MNDEDGQGHDGDDRTEDAINHGKFAFFTDRLECKVEGKNSEPTNPVLSTLGDIRRDDKDYEDDKTRYLLSQGEFCVSCAL